MVPLTGAVDLDVHASDCTAARERRPRPLTEAFELWLLGEPERGVQLAHIAEHACARVGAQQDFQTVAILGFAAHAGLLGTAQLVVLKEGLIRLAGREPVVSGVPMAFRADAVGILGISLGARAIDDVDVTSRVVQWAIKFLKASYDRRGTDDWRRCLFATADRQLGSPLGLLIPKSALTADVRTALHVKGLVDGIGGEPAPRDLLLMAALAQEDISEEATCEREALRRAAVQWLERSPVNTADAGAHSRRSPLAAQKGQPPGLQRNAKGPVRRNEKYKKIDEVLREIAEARPRSHEEVFGQLAGRVDPPDREPFKSAGGWLRGFQQNRPLASSWLSQAWGRLGLPPFPRGPKK